MKTTTFTPKTLFAVVLLLAGISCHKADAQDAVSIGTTDTKQKAILWLKSSDSQGQGLLLPAMNTAQRNAMNLNNTDEKGMMVFDNQLNAVFYWSGSEWVQAGAGGSGGNQDLALTGNVFTLSGSPVTVPLSFTAPTGGQVLMWNGTRWEAVSAGNDLSGPYNSSTVTGVRGRSIPALPGTGAVRALVYDPAGAGTWQFQEISAGGGSVTNVSGTAPITVTSPTTTPVISLANAGITETHIANGAVTSAKILDGTIAEADLANGAVTDAKILNVAPGKLTAGGASNGEVLQWNGSNWAPAAVGGTGTVTSITAGTGLDGGTITGIGTISIATGGVNTAQLADNAVTSAKLQSGVNDANRAVTENHIHTSAITETKIAPGAVTPAKLAPGNTNGQILKWNQATNQWELAADETGGGGGTVSVDGTTITGDGSAGNPLLVNAITSTQITDGTITNADISPAAQIAGSKLADGTVPPAKLTPGSTIGHVLKWNGTVWEPAEDLTAGGGGVVNVTGVAPISVASGSTTPVISLEPGTIIGQVLQWSGTAWTPAAVGGTGTVTNVSGVGAIDVADQSTTPVIRVIDEGIETIMLANNAVTTPKINNGAVTNAKIASGIDGAKLTDATVTYEKIATVDGGSLINLSVTGAKLADNAVGQDKIAAGAVTNVKIASVGPGKIEQAGATNGQVLKWNGTVWEPADEAGGGGFSALNIIPRGDGAGLVASQIFDNGTTSVGIGTVTPNATNKLEVQTSTDNAITARTTGAGGGYAIAGISTSGAGVVGTSYSTGAPGVEGESTGTGAGVSALGNNGPGLRAYSFNSHAAVFEGSIQIADGNEAAGHVLTSDATGVASWQTPAGGGSNWTRIGNNILYEEGNVMVGEEFYSSSLADVGIIVQRDGGDVYFETASGDESEGLVMRNSGAGSESGIVSNLLSGAGSFMNGKTQQALHIFNRSNRPIIFSTTDAERMRIDAAGNVGIGTTPANFFHVAGDVGGAGTIATLEGHSTTATRGPGISLLRSKGTVASPVAVVNGDYLGGFSVSGRTASAYNLSSGIQFNVDGVVSGTSVPGRITFSTTLLGASTTTERMRITNSGNVGIGSTAPANRLTVAAGTSIGSGYTATAAPTNGLIVQGNVGIGITTPNAPLQLASSIGNRKLVLYDVNNNDHQFYGFGVQSGMIRYQTQSNVSSHIFFAGATPTTSTELMRIQGNGNVGIGRSPAANRLEVEGNASKAAAGGWLANSDKRIKTDIQDIDNSLELIKKLRPVKFKYTQEWMKKHPSLKDNYYYNFIAQEFREVFPEAAQGSGEYVDGDKDEIIQIDTYHAQIVTIKAVQEQQKIIEAQQDEISKLKRELEEIKNYLNMELKNPKIDKNKN
ncbi:MAG: tail fiber domain-containing protein [Cyclobacteriaceae bacterium]|nr:tail fiber domain-containing protein [Cyclobacteriaceae bacterium]